MEPARWGTVEPGAVRCVTDVVAIPRLPAQFGDQDVITDPARVIESGDRQQQAAALDT